MLKLPHNCFHLFISHASKVMLKILQARLQQYVNENFQMFKLDLEKAEEPEIQWEFHKNIYFCFINYVKPLTVWITTNCGKFFKRWENQTTLPASWEICVLVKKQQLELDMDQQTGSK